MLPGIKAMPRATASENAAMVTKNGGRCPLLAAAAVKNGQATAPKLQKKLRRLNVALRRSGFAAATSKFAAGTANPNPAPYEAMERIPTILGPDNRHESPRVINSSPTFIGNLNPHRAANTPEHATAQVE